MDTASSFGVLFFSANTIKVIQDNIKYNMKKRLNIKCPKCQSDELYAVEVILLFKKLIYHACKKCGYMKNFKDLKQELSSR